MDSLVKYHSSLSNDFLEDAGRILRRADASSIHEIRVIIKKIRAIYHLIGFVNSSFDFNRYFNRYHLLFKSAGNIRDADISLRAINDIHGVSVKESEHITVLLRKKRKKDVMEIKQIVSMKLSEESSPQNAEIESFLMPIESGVIIHFFERIAFEIKKNNSRHIPAGKLHTVRKLCKEYLYISQASYCKDSNLKKTDELQKLIGNWHDRYIAMEYIRKEIKGGKKAKLFNELKKQEKYLKKEAIAELKIIAA